MTNTTTSAPVTADLRTRYATAYARYQAGPENPSAIRTLGWVYAELLKEASGCVQSGCVQSGCVDTKRMLRGLVVISEFPMVDDTRWRESVGWSICRFLLRHTPESLPLRSLGEVLRRGAAFMPGEPGLLRSVCWKALLRYDKAGIDWLGLVETHGWDGGFRPEDEQPESYGEGKQMRPLLEQLMTAVAKHLLAGVVLPETTAQPWLTRLADGATRHPYWDYLPYYHAKLLLRLDRTDEAMRVFLPFARRKKNDFWVWALLADLVAPEQVDACYARALSVGSPEAFLVKLRQRVAAWLIAQHRWADARAEIDRLVQTRQANSWPIPTEVQRWLNDDLYTQAESGPFVNWYAPLLPAADALLWADHPETIAVVTDLDTTAQYASVAVDAKTAGSFPVSRFGLRPAVGDRVALRYEQQEKNGRLRLRVLTARTADEAPTHLQTQTVTGPLRIPTGKSIGFVGDVYVPAHLLANGSELTDTVVRVDAVESWDSVKQKSGWRAFRIQKGSVNLSV